MRGRILMAVLVPFLFVACGGGGGETEPPRDTFEVVFTPDGGRQDVSLPDVPDVPALADVPPDIVGLACAETVECEGRLEGEGACLAAVCDPDRGVCALTPSADGTACDDGDACTTASACAAGVCVGDPGSAPDCDDANPCTTDDCDSEVGCTHDPNAALCDDGRDCTEDDRCREGVCRGVALDCDDGNACTDDLCREGQGCGHAFNAAPCDDRNACTANERCEAGICREGTPISCDDGNPCTSDSCQSVQGCRHTNNALPCEDSNPCTDGDQCVEGACRPGTYSPACPACTTDFECRPYDDDDPCDGTIICVEGQCRILPVTVRVCEQPADPCVRSVCNPDTEQCETLAKPDGAACDDGDRCSLSDACSEGACTGVPADCDDGNPCTEDRCDPATGCVHAPADAAPCDDGDPCTGGDACESGICAPGQDFLCVACLVDADCEALEDGDRCNGLLHCDGGTCRLDEASVVTCDASGDGPCRRTRCEPTTGECATEDRPGGTACDDGVRCTRADACEAGACVGTRVVCDDGDPCTIDSCDEATGSCINGPSPGPCEDGDPCTSNDTCVDGACIPGVPTDCNDGNPCTGELCTPLEGCVFTPVPGACDDGDACTTGDRCVEGDCVGDGVDCDDANPCTQDSCSAATGACAHSPVAGACDDGDVCTDGDACQGGACVSGPPRACDDGNPCTAGRCVDGVGCEYTPVAGGCDDDDACTTGDRCVDGTCVADGTLPCDDQNPCTDDGCDPVAGCTFSPNAVPCDDHDACTTGDQCSGSQCRGGLAAECDDGNLCTDDGCLPASGCTHAFNSVACDDGNPCTQPDQCRDGRCRGGPVVCTEDLCGDGTDDDTDGFTDCDDPDCLDVPPCLPCVPAEEIACAPTWGTPVTSTGSTLSPSATDDLATYPCTSGDYGGREYAYVFHSYCNQQVQVEVASRTPGTVTTYARLRLFGLQDRADRCDPRDCVLAGSMEQLTERSRSTMALPTRKGETYYIVVDGLEGDQGSYDLYFRCNLVSPSPNETDCADQCDNDGNGYVDCEDPACAGSPLCP